MATYVYRNLPFSSKGSKTTPSKSAKTSERKHQLKTKNPSVTNQFLRKGWVILVETLP